MQNNGRNSGLTEKNKTLKHLKHIVVLWALDLQSTACWIVADHIAVSQRLWPSCSHTYMCLC